MKNWEKSSVLSLLWAVLDGRSFRNMIILLFLIFLSSGLSVLMVLSVLPFLSFLVDDASVPEGVVSFFSRVLGPDADFVFWSGVLAITITILATCADLIKARYKARYLANRAAHFSSNLLAHAASRSHAQRLGEDSKMEKQILSEASAVSKEFLSHILMSVNALLVSVGLLGALFWAEPRFTLLVIVVFGGFYGVLHIFVQRSVRRAAAQRRAADAVRFRAAQETIRGAREIQMAAREQVFLDRFDKAVTRFAKSMSEANYWSQASGILVQGMFFVSLLGLILWVVSRPEIQEQGVASYLPILAMFAFAGKRIMPEIKVLINASTHLAYVRPIVVDYLNKTSSHQPDFFVPSPLSFSNSVEFDSVVFHHPQSHLGRPSLDNVSVTIQKGSRIGIVGHTGSGKSTFADMLMGLWEPDEGRVLVDGVPLTSESRRAWQQSVSFVPQDLFLFDGTIADNITLCASSKERDDERLFAALRLACLDDVVHSLEDGVHTVVGERGHKFSGGQRQRLGLARALYAHAEVLMLDEATSALDNVTERRFMDAIEGLPENLTIFVIAHRLSTLRGCDTILVFDQGVLVDKGSWKDLESRCEIFKDLVAAQSTS